MTRSLVSRPKLTRWKPLKHVNVAPQIAGWRERVTICIAAICNVGIAGAPAAIIGASDRMLTIRDAEYEPPQTKIFPLASHTVALLAGDMQTHAVVCPATSENIKRKQLSPLRMSDIADVFAEEFAAYRRARAERHLLTPINLNIDTLITAGHSLDPNMVADLIDKLQNYSVDAEAIICGIDATGAHIYKIVDPGEAVCFDTTNFAAIGSRDDEAEFMYARFGKSMPAQDVLLLVYSAKLRAQAAAGVGIATDMFAIMPEPGYFLINGNYLSELEGIWKRKLHRDFESLSVARGEIAAYIRKAIEQSEAATGDLKSNTPQLEHQELPSPPTPPTESGQLDPPLSKDDQPRQPPLSE